ncbi:MAG: ABC transporter permease [Cyclobacteriaceae bacterium]
MTLKENIREGINSVKGNKLRTFLTATIIALGIAALVGILTAIDSLQASLNSQFNSLGANSFDIRSKRTGGTRGGVKGKVYPPITYKEAISFKDKFGGPGEATLNTFVTGLAEAKRGSKVSNPNLRVQGADENYLAIEGVEIDRGRNFSQLEVTNGGNVVIIGNEVKGALFDSNIDPIGKSISFLGTKFRVIGLLESQGGVNGGGLDRGLIVPLETGRKLSGNRTLRYDITVGLKDATQMDFAIGTATGLMRKIRGDQPVQKESFEIRQNKTLSERLGDIAIWFQAGGGMFAFITLLGASIGLMNIMLVSVTERTREIGVRKALGATPSKIRQQFLIEAILVCQLGGLGGIILGILFGNLVPLFIGGGTFIIPWKWIIIGVTIGFIVGILSGFIPARRASKLDPIDSLRFE